MREVIVILVVTNGEIIRVNFTSLHLLEFVCRESSARSVVLLNEHQQDRTWWVLNANRHGIAPV